MGLLNSFGITLALLGLTSAGLPPVFIWSSRNLDVKVTVPLGQVLSADSYKDKIVSKILKALPGTNVALFVQDRLSSQDLIRYGDAHGEDGVFPNLRRFMLSDAHALWLDRVQDPADAFDIHASGVSVKDVPDPTVLTSLLRNADPHLINVFKIHLHDTPLSGTDRRKVLKANDEVMGDVMRQLEQINHPIVGILTGNDATFDAHVIKKRAPPTEEEEEEEDEEEEDTSLRLSTNGCKEIREKCKNCTKMENCTIAQNRNCEICKIWTSPCVQVYAKQISLVIYQRDVNGTMEKGKVPFWFPEKVDQDCPDQNVTMNSTTISAFYKYQAETTTGDITDSTDGSATITLNFNRTSWGWMLLPTGEVEGIYHNTKVNITDNVTIDNITASFQHDLVIPLEVFAPKKFSYHCTNPGSFKPSNFTLLFNFTLVDIEDFQVQALMVGPYGKDNLQAFGNTFDCVNFFSIPILMGLGVALLLVLAVTVGVTAIASINTQDRFDDPNGPTITVPLGD